MGVPDPDSPIFPIEAGTFKPAPMNPLPFPSLIVVSSDDPFGTPEFARACARAWGGGIINIGAKGHINAESNLGNWREGLEQKNEIHFWSMQIHSGPGKPLYGLIGTGR